MNKFTQPILVPFKKPYPLVVNDGDIYTQMAALLIQTEKGEMVSHPVLEMDFITDGQVLTDINNEEMDPVDCFFKIGCNKGDRISWKQFINIANSIMNQTAKVSITDIYSDLLKNNVEIDDDSNEFVSYKTNEHLNVFVISFDNGIEYTYGDTMAFNWKKEKMCSPEEKYHFFIEQIVEHMELVPFYELNLLHVRTDKEFLDKYQKLENDIKDYIKEKEEKRRTPPPRNQILDSIDYIKIAECIQRTNSHDDDLTRIMKEFHIDQSHLEHIRHFINQHFVTTSKLCFIDTQQGKPELLEYNFQRKSLLKNEKP